MSTLDINLFGKFCVKFNGRMLNHLEGGKVQELFCYLLLYRNRPHPRENLGTLLWGECSTAQSKKYLRQTLWQLQTALDSQLEVSGEQVLEADANWVQLNSKAEVSLDVAVFEQVFARVTGRPGRELDEQTAQSLQAALELYQGDLLEGWYQDWCLFERERLQNMYLTMLDKQMSYCEACHKYELGLVYGTLILYYDRAHERTHRRLMHLQYLAGDRTAALRQFEKCTNALEKELGVKPDARTMRLYEQIRGGQYDDSNLRTPQAEQAPTAAATGTADSPPEVHALGRLKQLQVFLTNIQSQVRQDILAIELSLKGRR